MEGIFIVRSLKSAVLKVLGIYLIGCVVITLCLVADEIVPRTKTHFWNYQLFNMYTDFTIYPKELPESAYNIKYYYYEGLLADKSGYRVTYSREDYEQMKESRLIAYNPYLPELGYCYDGGVKHYLDRKQMKERRIDFLDKLLPEEQDDEQYYCLAYGLCETQEIYSYHCIFCNDETCEILEISCRCPN
ncbi:MAG: hypothetical protein K2H41_00540 [Acetatifactor sp.]|nr:hypothetical protein [Acetatifactor sp.]